MSDIDLTDAVSAAGAESLTPCSLCERPGVTLCQPCRDETEWMLRAALPHIEKQIRAQVADEIEAAINGDVMTLHAETAPIASRVARRTRVLALAAARGIRQEDA